MDTVAYINCGPEDVADPSQTNKDGQQTAEQIRRSCSLCSSQTYAESLGWQAFSHRSPSYDQQQASPRSTRCDEDVHMHAMPLGADTDHSQHSAGWLNAPERPADGAWLACIDMMRHHQAAEVSYSSQLCLRGQSSIDEGSRTIVVSWLVEIAEEFGLQQESLHSAVALLDRFLAIANAVPRCVLQLVAVGCVFLATKQLEVTPPSAEQLVAVAAHSFSKNDLLRVERVLLDCLDFCVAPPTAYSYLHLLTQACLTASSSSSSSTAPMEVIVSLAMYLAELAIVNQPMTAVSGSQLATSALLLAHATISGDCSAWPSVLEVSGLLESDVTHVTMLLSQLHVAAWDPKSDQLRELLLPLKLKFGQQCWWRVSLDVVPLLLQQQQR